MDRDEVEYSRTVAFRGNSFEVTVIVRECMESEGETLSVEVENEAGERWQSGYSAKYLEDLTAKTGNFKRAGTLARMLLGALEGTADSVYMDLLTSADLAALGRKAAVDIGEQGDRRYLILTYATSFDRVHYPLPLDVEEPTEQSRSRQLKRLERKLESVGLELKTSRAECAKKDNELRLLRQENDKLKRALASRGRPPTRQPTPPPARKKKSASPARRDAARASRSPSPQSRSFQRFDPTAYQRDRERRIAAAAQRRRQPWGASRTSEDGYSSSDSRRSTQSFPSSKASSSAAPRRRRRRPPTKKQPPIPRTDPRPGFFQAEPSVSPRTSQRDEKHVVVSPDEKKQVPHPPPPPSDDIKDIDRRLNALQAFLREAKTKRF